MKLISHRKITQSKHLMRITFEKSGYDVFFEMSTLDRDFLYKYINGELHVNGDSHMEFDAPTFQIKEISTGKVYLEGRNLSIILTSLYPGELKVSLMGISRGSTKSTIIGVIRIEYNENVLDEKML